MDAPRPRICFLPAVTGSVPTYLRRFLDAFPARSFEPTYLDLFDRTVADVSSFLGEQNVIYAGGGAIEDALPVVLIG